MKPRVLLLAPDNPGHSALDQSAGARLAWRRVARDIDFDADVFPPAEPAALERKARSWVQSVTAIVGATNVPLSARLGAIAEEAKVLCFVANNNPAVWRGRRHVFHIGLPTAQTAAAVARLLAEAGFGSVYLLHDQTEFQSRVAKNMEKALEQRKVRVKSGTATAGWKEEVAQSDAALLYLVYSAEAPARVLARECAAALPRTPLLFGRSLLRQSFIDALGAAAERALFVDLFRRGTARSAAESALVDTLSREGTAVATANHGFGWDAMTLCALALAKAGGEVETGIEYLESGVALEGATGSFQFHKENHNGREGFGPTRISRWYQGRLEEAYHD